MSVSVMYRQVQSVKADCWSAFLTLEKEIEKTEREAGYPIPRRYRALFGGEPANTRVSVRIFESYAEFGRLISERYLDDEFSKLDGRMKNLLEWEREELYYLDSGAPVPRWMQAISRKPFAPEHVECAIARHPIVAEDSEKIKKNIAEGKIRVLYRQIQHVHRDCWAEKLEQERLSDEAEFLAGNPLPLRYRSMHSPLDSHTRVSEREYESLAALCEATENFLAESTPADVQVMDAEARRQEFFSWEREELYYVDSDSYLPSWQTTSE